MKTFLMLFFFVLSVSFCNTASAQRITVFGGTKLPSYSKSTVQLTYVDESPDPDLFQSTTNLKNSPYYSVGASYDNYDKVNVWYFNLIGNLYFGELLGVDLGISSGYTFHLNKSKSMSVIPALTAGLSYLDKKMGTLKNNTVYVQVNNTRFGDYQDVDVSLVKTNYFVKPNLSFVMDITQSYQLRLTGAYMIDIPLDQFIGFSGKDNSGKVLSDKEDVNASNLSYQVNGSNSKDIPLDMKGLEFKLGIGFKF